MTLQIHNFYLSDDGVADVDGVTADAGRGSGQRAGPAVARPGTAGVGAGGGGAKRDLDACALVCRRWRRLERASRRSAKLAASGERADEVLRLVAERFTALAEVSVDEHPTAGGTALGSTPRSYHSGMVHPYRVGMVRLASPSHDPGAGIPACRRRRHCVRRYANCDKKMSRLVSTSYFWARMLRTYRRIGGTKLGFRLLWNF